MNLTSLSLTDQRDLVKSREVNASDLTAACYRQIERLNPTLNAFITVIPPEKLTPLGDGHSMPLYGIPLAVKDLYDTEGILTTSGSRFFADYVHQEDAFVVTKRKSAGTP